MIKKTIIITGRIPSKKNQRNCFVKFGRQYNIPSKQYTAWHKDASLQLLKQHPGLLENIIRIELFFYAPDKRASDMSNKMESIMDFLVDNNVITDDNWYIINKVILTFKGVDRQNPRCEIYIYVNE
jgi:Holliday junction resolvase RusA-like endonuclease